MRLRNSVLALSGVLIVGALAGCGSKPETGDVKSEGTANPNTSTAKPAATGASGGGAASTQSVKPKAD